MKLDYQSLNGFRNCKSLCCCLCVYRGALEKLKYIEFQVTIKKNTLILRIMQFFYYRQKINELYLAKMNVRLDKRSATKIIQKPLFYCVLNVCTAPLVGCVARVKSGETCCALTPCSRLTSSSAPTGTRATSSSQTWRTSSPRSALITQLTTFTTTPGAVKILFQC